MKFYNYYLCHFKEATIGSAIYIPTQSQKLKNKKKNQKIKRKPKNKNKRRGKIK